MGSNLLTYDQLAELFDLAGQNYDNDYSGRYMYGKKCISFEYSEDYQLGEIHGNLEEAAASLEIEQEFYNTWKGLRTDNMGRDFVAYFPNVITPEDKVVVKDW